MNDEPNEDLVCVVCGWDKCSGCPIPCEYCGEDGLDCVCGMDEEPEPNDDFPMYLEYDDWKYEHMYAGDDDW